MSQWFDKLQQQEREASWPDTYRLALYVSRAADNHYRLPNGTIVKPQRGVEHIPESFVSERRNSAQLNGQLPAAGENHGLSFTLEATDTGSPRVYPGTNHIKSTITWRDPSTREGLRLTVEARPGQLMWSKPSITRITYKDGTPESEIEATEQIEATQEQLNAAVQLALADVESLERFEVPIHDIPASE